MQDQIEKYFTGELNLDERLSLLRAVESDRKVKEAFTRYRNTQALLSFSDTVINREECARGYRSFQLRIKRKKVYQILRKSLGYAAVITLLVIAIHLYRVFAHDLHFPVPAETSLLVPAGQRVSVTLSDGTTVWLNARSRLTYPTDFSGEERNVNLEGEAYFEVAYNKDKPFIVTTTGMNIKVLGTDFNVRNYEKENFSRVSLLEGSLQVCDLSIRSGGIILRPNEEVTIRDGYMSVMQMSDTGCISWKEGIYSFRSEEFGAILKKLELYYDVEIIVKEPSMLKWQYTVKFRQQDGIDEILRLLQRIHPFHLQKEEENNRIVLYK